MLAPWVLEPLVRKIDIVSYISDEDQEDMSPSVKGP